MNRKDSFQLSSLSFFFFLEMYLRASVMLAESFSGLLKGGIKSAGVGTAVSVENKS